MDIVALGEPLFEFNQIPGSSDYRQGFGGDTSNFTIAAARTGARTAYLTRLGDETFGRQFLALWAREGVDTSAIELDPVAPTGLYFISHGPAGHEFSYRRAGSAASLMHFGEPFARVVRGARLLHVSGISQAISNTACDCVFDALALARASGVRTSYDLNFRPRLWPVARARAIAQATLPLIDLFLPSLDEARVLFGIDSAQALIDWSHAQGARNVAVKMGVQGAILSADGALTTIAAHRVDAVDATGAGDCFGGVLAARWIAGDSLPDAARAACVAAALSTTGYGAVDPLPTWPVIRAALHQTPM